MTVFRKIFFPALLIATLPTIACSQQAEISDAPSPAPTETTAPAAAPQQPCSADAYRQFDFWIGEWDVTPAGSPSPRAVNRISQEHGGCALVENYVAGAFTGMSVNFYDGARDKWHQTWISNAGGALYIEGGLNESGQMILTDKGLPSSASSNAINKITWTPNEDSSVRQFWETSTDQGETWTVAFDGLYTKRRSEED